MSTILNDRPNSMYIKSLKSKILNRRFVMHQERQESLSKTKAAFWQRLAAHTKPRHVILCIFHTLIWYMVIGTE